MRQREEARARARHDDLARLFAGQQRVRVSVNGHRARWTCSVETDLRRCNVTCLDEAVEQYLTEFVAEGQIVARGGTSSPDETGSAISKWIGNASLQELYDYRFVDRGRRFLEGFKDKTLVRHPALQSSARVEIRHIVSDLHELSLRNDDRSVRVGFYGTSAAPDAYFSWDECEMFRMMVSDTDGAADVVDRWLTEHAMPSTIKAVFPSIEVHPVARFYEQGRPIEGEFLVSWDDIEQFYEERYANPDITGPAMRLVRAMRAAGFDRTLRAGQSMYTLVVSRSRRHGLRSDQPFIALSFLGERLLVRTHLDEEQEIWLPSELGNALLAELRCLEQKPID